MWKSEVVCGRRRRQVVCGSRRWCVQVVSGVWKS